VGNVSTTGSASALIGYVDTYLDVINSTRATLGAIQNRFEAVVRNGQNVAENLTASRSRIQDADFALETARMTRAQILQQAGISMLAQANSQPQNVLSLLQ
jgi:flagellin